LDRARLSSEQVSDFIQRNGNHFPALEIEAERLLAAPGDATDGLFSGLSKYLLTAHGVRVHVVNVHEMRGAVRRFDTERRELLLSEVLRRGSRNLQLAAQIALLRCSRTLDELAVDPLLTSDESRALCRVALANYFAGAVLMPYDTFL